MIGLIILGHGSNLPNYRDVVEIHRKRIEELGVFNEVRTAFIIEEPRIDDVISEMKSEKILVVPLFISWGEHLREIKEKIQSFDNVVLCNPIGESELVTYAIILSALRMINVLKFR